jgi:ABC-type multidrug transport system ATPase subunit
MSDIILETIGLVHTYPGGTTALKGIDLQVKRGEQVSIIGQNGSGKTTMVRHFNGLLRPTEGKVIVDGQDSKDLSIGQLSRLPIAGIVKLKSARFLERNAAVITLITGVVIAEYVQ